MEAGEEAIEAQVEQGPAGIIIRGGLGALNAPVIAAFIWGGKVRPVPTLPFGRWKPATS
ncbi:MAG: hypothetical protein ACRELD_04805 [Longimicrobiales bacterium]